MYLPIDAFSAGGPPPPLPHEIITSPTDLDVLNGRGQGVQRHLGNVNYRKLVHVNKVLYAKCPRADKMKISKGIVDAVRHMGGRFLELDERSGIYNDIGEKKAVEKTSQALREGQVDIRKNMYAKDEAKAAGDVQPPNIDHEMSPEGYFVYSVQVLQSLHRADKDELASSEESSEDTLRRLAEAATVSRTPDHVSSAYVQAPTPPTAHGNNQFPVAINSPYQGDPSLQGPIGRFTDMSRYTNISGMSLTSIFSINSLRQLIESAQNGNCSSEDRATIESVMNAELQDMIRMTLPQLQEIENMGDDYYMTNHEDREVELNYNDMDDRVSELRFTEYEYSNIDGIGAAQGARTLGSTLSMMSITDNHVGGERGGV
ncbi:hypothetical protein ACHAXA_000920 [Cyclostephanos tholiformis]|uniref:DUF6824 domain-containing protein n=1 Tax=Cyclostephanos tholiformis TaxID=382380 RepID=A0ABD3RG77_9STRA